MAGWSHVSTIPRLIWGGANNAKAFLNHCFAVVFENKTLKAFLHGTPYNSS
jgi:hypothetical protein